MTFTIKSRRSVTKTDPFDAFGEQLSDFFNDRFGSKEDVLTALRGEWGAGDKSPGFVETEGGYRIEIPLPGIAPDKVSAEIGSNLVVRVTSSVAERTIRVAVPTDADQSTARASMVHGLLTVDVDRRCPHPPTREIEIVPG